MCFRNGVRVRDTNNNLTGSEDVKDVETRFLNLRTN